MDYKKTDVFDMNVTIEDYLHVVGSIYSCLLDAFCCRCMYCEYDVSDSSSNSSSNDNDLIDNLDTTYKMNRKSRFITAVKGLKRRREVDKDSDRDKDLDLEKGTPYNNTVNYDDQKTQVVSTRHIEYTPREDYQVVMPSTNPISEPILEPSISDLSSNENEIDEIDETIIKFNLETLSKLKPNEKLYEDSYGKLSVDNSYFPAITRVLTSNSRYNTIDRVVLTIRLASKLNIEINQDVRNGILSLMNTYSDSPDIIAKLASI